MSGLKAHCLYSLEPYLLGFCGPIDRKKSEKLIASYLQGQKVDTKQLRKICKEFVAAYRHYELIAQKNSLSNPLSLKVVQAYWLGNDLLKKAGGCRAHHSWHVLKVGSITGRVKLTFPMMDLCRVSWGQVKEIRKDILVSYRPLRKKAKQFYLGQEIDKKISWNKKFLPNLKKGDIITIHWNQVIEKISQQELINLQNYTLKTLNNI